MSSPLNSILVGGRRRAPGLPRFGVAACVALMLTLAFPSRVAAAPANERAVSDGDVRKAEKILAKLRLLHAAAEAGDADAYRRLASKLYPDLFVKVAELQPGDLSTDLSTAVFIAEELGRTWDDAGVTADCRSERPDIYRPLCFGLRDGTVRGLLLAKSRLHARWALAVVMSQRGEADAETAGALREMADARANDVLIAVRIVETLIPLEGLRRASAVEAARGERLATSAYGFEESAGEFADTLRAAGALLAWMPRSQTFYRLSGAQQAYADGLFWYRKVSQSKRLVVSVSSFAPDPLKVIDLDAGQAGAAATANWKSAAQLVRLTEQSLSKEAR